MFKVLASVALLGAAFATRPSIKSDVEGNLKMGIPAGKTFVVDCPDVDDEAKRFRSDLTECLAAVDDLEGNLTTAETAAAVATAAATAAAAAAETAASLMQDTVNYGTIIAVTSCDGVCGSVSGGTVQFLVIGDLFNDVANAYTCVFTGNDGTTKIVPAVAKQHTQTERSNKFIVECAAPVYTREEVNAMGMDNWSMNASVTLPGRPLAFLTDDDNYLLHIQTEAPTLAAIPKLEFLSNNKVNIQKNIDIVVSDVDSKLSDVTVQAVSSDDDVISITGVAGKGGDRVLSMKSEAEEGTAVITVTAKDEHDRTTVVTFEVIISAVPLPPCRDRPNGPFEAEAPNGKKYNVYCQDGWTQVKAGNSWQGGTNQASKDSGHSYFSILPCTHGRSRDDLWHGPTQSHLDSNCYGKKEYHPLWTSDSGGAFESKMTATKGNGPSNRNNFQKWVAPFRGDYEFTLEGARGGKDCNARPGNGGKVKVTAKNVLEGTAIYFRVGAMGIDGRGRSHNGYYDRNGCPSGDPSINNGVYPWRGGSPWVYDGRRWNGDYCSGRWNQCGGFNGGGPILACHNPGGSSGGGATDVRICKNGGDCEDSRPSLKKRFAVAAGGGGSSTENNRCNYYNGHGGHGGGNNGQSNWEAGGRVSSRAEGGRSDRGGRTHTSDRNNAVNSHGSGDGWLGQGGNCGQNDCGGGGGGYYGGAGSPWNAGGAGGSNCQGDDCKPDMEKSKDGVTLTFENSKNERGTNSGHGYILMRIK